MEITITTDRYTAEELQEIFRNHSGSTLCRVLDGDHENEFVIINFDIPTYIIKEILERIEIKFN